MKAEGYVGNKSVCVVEMGVNSMKSKGYVGGRSVNAANMGENSMKAEGYKDGKSVRAVDHGGKGGRNNKNNAQLDCYCLSKNTKTAMAYTKDCFTGEGMYKKSRKSDNPTCKLYKNYYCVACSVGAGKTKEHSMNQWIVVCMQGVMVELMLTPEQARDKVLRDAQATALTKKFGYIR